MIWNDYLKSLAYRFVIGNVLTFVLSWMCQVSESGVVSNFNMFYPVAVFLADVLFFDWIDSKYDKYVVRENIKSYFDIKMLMPIIILHIVAWISFVFGSAKIGIYFLVALIGLLMYSGHWFWDRIEEFEREIERRYRDRYNGI